MDFRRSPLAYAVARERRPNLVRSSRGNSQVTARGIRVNAVSPGVIQTPDHAPDTYDGLAALRPLGRVGQVSDIVGGILYLEASLFVTGGILHIDGGQSAGH
ncbi:SDR family oxidoreductase [Marmoricola sp. URHB0036]|uniref:SDR family oxidoreductase n=1 Tax=Marmoricola sp. URHB0036 TaxID=1298863 RepID=UPI0009DC211A|nr:SDR family oxidoreductase [Marmoricola sp. URHB0036]